MKTYTKLLSLLAAGCLCTSGAMAISFGDGGSALQGELDTITTAPVAGSSSVDVTTDYLDDALDSYWSITASGGSVSTVIIEIAAFAADNKFGVYDSSDPTKTVEIFAGAASSGSQAVLSIKADGSVFVNFADTGIDFQGNSFGYYLDTQVNQPGVGLWHSDTLLNSDGIDHMAAYQGSNTDTVQLPTLAPGLWTPNEYILAWEDLNNGGDRDYTDFVVMIESVNPVPDGGAAILMLGLALLGISGLKRKLA